MRKTNCQKSNSAVKRVGKSSVYGSISGISSDDKFLSFAPTAFPIKMKAKSGGLLFEELTDFEFQKLLPKIQNELRKKNLKIHLDKYSILAAKIFLSNKKLHKNTDILRNISDIIYSSDAPEKLPLVAKLLSEKELYSNTNLVESLSNILRSPNVNYLTNQNIAELQKGVDAQRNKVLEAPEKYINGEYESDMEIIDAVLSFFEENVAGLLIFSSIYDKETYNYLLRMRFEKVDEYVGIIESFSPSDIELLSKMNKALNMDGNTFTSVQKIEFTDLLYAYKRNNLEITKIEEMAASGKIDLAQLEVDLFNGIMKNSGFSEEEIASIPKEKLVAWNIKYAHLLSKEINASSDAAFNDLLRAGNLELDFLRYIHRTSNVYGKANAKTKKMYEQKGMDYNKWLNPSKENEIVFISKDINIERLKQIAAQVIEDMNSLMKTPVKEFLKKQFPKYVKGDEFIILNEYLSNKTKLQEFIKMLSDTSKQGQMFAVWNKAKCNAESPNPKVSMTARGTLMILDHLNQRLKDLDNISETEVEKQRNWTIKMWDRNPQKDIFQGNYSTCCIGMGGENGSAMPHYIMNTAYNMIEIVDNVSGKTIGNALCYFVINSKGKPVFVVDNIEINNAVKPSYKVGLQLRNAIAQYAENVSKEVTGNKTAPIYMSSSYNDVPCDGLACQAETLSFLGDIDCNQIYLDLYGGWLEKNNFTRKLKVLKLKQVELRNY